MSRFLFANRYQAGDVIGRGTMSEVYRGQDKLVGRDVAIKVLRADLARDPSFQARFRREAKNAAALNHPAIVAVYDTGERETAAGAIPFIVMEYVAGQTLQEKLKWQAAAAAAGSRWRLPPKSVRRWTSRTGAASCTATSSRRT